MEGQATQTEEMERKRILSKNSFKTLFLTFLGCDAALRVFHGSGRGVPNENGQLGFWLQINQRSRSQLERQEMGTENGCAQL